MNDSLPTEDPSATASKRPSLLSSADEGVGELLAAFERKVLGAGDETRAMGGTGSGDAPAEADAAAEPSRRDVPPGRTYEDVLAPIRWRNIALAVLAAIVLVGLYFAATLLQVWLASDDDETRETDAIVVLGAAQFDGTPSPVFAARLDQALELWQAGFAPHIVTTGSGLEGDRFTEGFSGYVYLLERGVPDEALIPIVDGGDTWQQLSATAVQLDGRQLQSALLVSDGYHSFRLRQIADEVGIDAYVSPTDVDGTLRDYMREAAAVSIGRIFGYRRISAVNTPDS